MLRNQLSLLLAALFALSPALPSAAQTVEWTLSNSNASAQTEEDQDIDDWDSDVINITVVDPGVLAVLAHGTRFKGTSGDEEICGTGTRTLPGGWFARQNASGFSIPVRAGDYTIELTPHGAGWVKYRVAAKLLDACGMESGDDHGNSPLCATDVCIDSAENGSIGSYTPADDDYFSFVLSSTTPVTVSASGSTSVDGELFDEEGQSLAVDDDGSFSISESLAPGRYFVKLQGHDGATGSYSLLVAD